MELFIVGQWPTQNGGASWEFVGVFSTRELAEAACTDSTYFVGPTTLDFRTPEESTDWPGCYYPRA